jgi:UDP-N-acetylglucosamine:LPS N-acetylglucosamine transferase
MAFNIAFYIHHHGSGHLMRSLSIAAHLDDCKITFLGSDLDRYRSIIPEHVQLILLPADTKSDKDHWSAERNVAGLHYAPLSVAGQTIRVAMLSNFFKENPQLLLVVDVSVEVAMLATLCGVPTVVVRQHGKRDDLPHILAYKNAISLLAPYGRNLQPKEEEWLSRKTFFSGGFSRFNVQTDRENKDGRQVAVLVGSGGTSIDKKFIYHLLGQCINWHFHLVGDIEGINKDDAALNLTVYNHVQDPLAILSECSVVIGNAGHNTVMEIASLNKRMILIPENRPFQEQIVKAQLLEKLNFARVILPGRLFKTDWCEELNKMTMTVPDWSDTVVKTAASDTADYLRAIYAQQYSNAH